MAKRDTTFELAGPSRDQPGHGLESSHDLCPSGGSGKPSLGDANPELTTEFTSGPRTSPVTLQAVVGTPVHSTALAR
jgi:hypothetical protein